MNLAANAVGLSATVEACQKPVYTSGFHAPTICEFYPAALLFEGTPFELNRIMAIRLLVMVLLIVIFTLWTSKFKKAYKTQQHVPSRFQLMGEISLNFVRKTIAHEQLGEKDGDRFLPLLATMFFIVLGMNITGIVPGLNIAGSSLPTPCCSRSMASQTGCRPVLSVPLSSGSGTTMPRAHCMRYKAFPG